MLEPTKKPVDPEQEAKLAEKETKKQIESYYEVAKHRLGRVPTMEEIVAVMSEQTADSEHPESEQVLMPNEEAPEELSQEEQEGPDILHMKVYHGMKNGEPDKGKILYYESPRGSVYDCATQEWTEDRPEIIDHLHSRPMQYEEQDIIAAIVNGVMGDEDYDALSSVGMMGENSQKLWDLTKTLQTQVEDLERAQVEPPEHLGKSDDEEEESFGDGTQEDSGDEYEESDRGCEQEEVVQGSDLISEMIHSAMSEAMTSPYLEETIRKIVREEMSGGKSENSSENDEKKLDTPEEY